MRVDMRVAGVSLTVLALSLLAPAGRGQASSLQQASSKPAAPVVTLGSSSEGLKQALSCPVSLDVRHGTGWARRSPVGATDGFTRKPPAQALDVTVLNRASSEITSLDVFVRLRSVKPGVMPVASEGENLGERLALHFDMSVKADTDAAGLWMVASTDPVAYIEISKVTYRDGSMWSASKGSACQFTPNPLMLISSR